MNVRNWIGWLLFAVLAFALFSPAIVPVLYRWFV